MGKRSPLVDLLESGVDSPEKKDAFHKQAPALLRKLAAKLALKRGDFEVRSNRAGIAVAGEVSLRGPTLFLQVCGHDLTLADGTVVGVFYRRATAEDRYGARSENRWLPYAALRDLDAVAAAVRALP